jgi:hypothetical protein
MMLQALAAGVLGQQALKDPALLRPPQGQRVSLELVNKTRAAHGLAPLDELP